LIIIDYCILQSYCYIKISKVFHFVQQFNKKMLHSSNEPSSSEPRSIPDLIDLIVVLWIILSLLIISNSLYQSWAGKATYLLTEISLLISVIAYLSFRKLKWITLMRWRSIPVQSWLPLLLMSAGASVLLDEIDRIVQLVMPMPVEQLRQLQEMVHFETPLEMFWIFTSIVLVAPLIEETLFRGLIQKTIEFRYSPTKAILSTSMIFALIHLQPWWIIQLLIISVLAGYLAWKSNSILPGVFVHVVSNLWSLIIMNETLLNLSRYYLWKGHVSPIWIIIALAIFRYNFRRVDKLFS